MSLNGLDEAKVAEAHQAALAEAGGWFLLKYTTRDTVELLSRGSGGVAEVRSTITKYQEKSPLYGLVQFRRKKIILKYVPDGTSRLLQVRLTVQFQSILETFVPHDTVLSFTAPSELTESALTSACMLHPSAMSLTSSSSSLRRQPLGEISEDAEESPHVRGQSKSKVAATPAAPFIDFPREEQKEPVAITVFAPVVEKTQPVLPSALQEVALPAKANDTGAVHSPGVSTTRASSITPAPTPVPTAEKALPTTPEPTPPNTSDGKSTLPPTPDDAPTLPPIQHFSNSFQVEENVGRASIHSARPSVIDSERPSFSSHEIFDSYKPKIKRAPRPHVDPETRPKTAGSIRNPQAQRRVANLPSSVRTQNRSAATDSSRPGSQHSSRSVPSKFIKYTSPPVVPPLPSPTHISSLFLPQSQHEPTYSRAGSITSTATATATPEKLRLMKALQMRKRTQQHTKRESEKSKSPEEPLTSTQSQVEADLQSILSQTAGRQSRAESTSASQMEEATKPTEAAIMASPTSMTNVSEVPSTQSSSLVEDNDGITSHASISSDTSSSVTPKADAREAQQRKQAENQVPVPALVTTEPSIPPAQQASDVVNSLPISQEVENAVPLHSAKSRSSSISSEESLHEQSAPPHEHSTVTNRPEPAVVTPDASKSASQAAESNPMEEERRPPVPSKSGYGHTRRRRGADLKAIKVLSSPDLSEASDDDSFMEELQHAEVQQAKPVAVGRSPATPIYHSLSASIDRAKENKRTVSTPLNDTTKSGSTSPDHAKSRSIRSVSTALPSWPPSEPMPLAKKGPLSSGISKRIKALEVFTSGRETNSSPQPPSPNNAQAEKSKAALTSSRKRLSFLSRGNSPNTSTSNAPPTSIPTSAQTFDTDLTDSELSKSMYPRQSSAPETYRPQQKGETISVTARIVRNPNTIHEDSVSVANDSQPVPLQRSKLTFEHEQPDPRESKIALTRDASTLSLESSQKYLPTERGRLSFSSHRSDSQTHLPISESKANRLSVVSGRKKDKGSVPRSNSDNSSLTEEKSKQSRARRLMQRVSNLSTSSRRNIAGAFSSGPKEPVAANTITERAESDHDLASVAESVSHVDIGDINVQFPDTLLWKRRFLRIDDQGYLIFTPPTMERNTRNISRRFHLSEFQKPTLPDVEREEMAWSILLDFEDGSCIQCACESRYTQKQVLRMLVDAHSAYHQLYSA